MLQNLTMEHELASCRSVIWRVSVELSRLNVLDVVVLVQAFAKRNVGWRLSC